MGTFIDTYGTPSIPKDKLPEFRARTLAIAEQGGMMTISHITMFGRHLTLLKPVEAGKYACIDFYYNYFEEECWENAGFSSETQCLYSNKIGRRIFNRVMRALYILQELYSEAPCFPHIDGQLFDATDELGWLNYLFNANFANNRVPALNRDTFHLESEGKPVPPIGTAAFLQVADDERAYWWRVDVQFSPEMESWLALLRQEYQKITAYPGPAPANYPEILVATLERAEKECGTHFFADAFEEFMGHSSFRDVQAAILLASRLIDGYAPGGEFLARDGWKWDVPRHNDDFGAYAIKLYFAVLGNPLLRQGRKYLNFKLSGGTNMNAAQYRKELVENIEHNALGPNDTFQFTCKECGECCRNRATPVMLTGLDIYRMAKGLGIDPYEVLARYTTGYLGQDSHAPVVVLRERLDGSCSLLRNGKCIVHSCKPIACAVHPIGRVIDLTQKKSIYIRQPGGCKGAVGGRTWTLDEWLDTWGLKELDAPSLAWNLMAGMVAEVMHPIKLEDIGRDVIWELYQHLYGDYDAHRDFIPQVEENSEAIRQFFKSHKMLK